MPFAAVRRMNKQPDAHNNWTPREFRISSVRVSDQRERRVRGLARLSAFRVTVVARTATAGVVKPALMSDLRALNPPNDPRLRKLRRLRLINAFTVNERRSYETRRADFLSAPRGQGEREETGE